MTHVAFNFTSALLLATSPVFLETVTKVTYLSTRCALCQAASPAAWMAINKHCSVWEPCLAFLFLGLACDLCLDMFETAEVQGMLRYYLCFPLLCLLVSISSGRRIVKFMFCVAIHILGVWVFLCFHIWSVLFPVFLFMYHLKDFLKTEIGNACFVPGAALRILLSTFKVRYLLLMDELWRFQSFLTKKGPLKPAVDIPADVTMQVKMCVAWFYV